MLFLRLYLKKATKEAKKKRRLPPLEAKLACRLNGFACETGRVKPGLRSLDQQIPLELSHNGYHLHGHFGSWSGQIATPPKAKQ